MYDSPRAMAKLLKEAKRVKQVLSANTDHIAQVRRKEGEGGRGREGEGGRGRKREREGEGESAITDHLTQVTVT